MICGGTGGRKVFLFPSTFGWLAAVVVIKRKKKALLFPPFSPLFYRSWKFGEWKRYKKFGKPCQGQNLENFPNFGMWWLFAELLSWVRIAIPRSRKALLALPFVRQCHPKVLLHAYSIFPQDERDGGRGILRNFPRSSIPRGYWEGNGGIWR